MTRARYCVVLCFDKPSDTFEPALQPELEIGLFIFDHLTVSLLSCLCFVLIATLRNVGLSRAARSFDWAGAHAARMEWVPIVQCVCVCSNKQTNKQTNEGTNRGSLVAAQLGPFTFCPLFAAQQMGVEKTPNISYLLDPRACQCVVTPGSFRLDRAPARYV